LDQPASFLGRQTSLTRRGGAPSSSASFGLFGDDDDDADDDKNSAHGRASEAPGGPAELFGKVAAVSAEPRAGGGQSAETAVVVTYNDFLARLMRPESNDLAHHVKLFLGSVLGPSGDGAPPLKHQTATLPYRFYGTHMLPRRCLDFFEAIERAMAKHSAWKDLEASGGLAQVRNHAEKYVMTKLADLALLGERDDAQDAALAKRMAVLAFLQPEALEVNPNLRENEVVWTIAQDELRKMASFKAPGDKIACVVKCCQVIFSVLNLKRGGDDTSRPGADDFLPIFIYVVLKAQVPNLYTNCEYIQQYHNPAALMSKAGYCFVNLRSAVEFILTLDASVLSMDAGEFNAKLAEAEARWEAEHA
jgi:hypothetical protein